MVRTVRGFLSECRSWRRLFHRSNAPWRRIVFYAEHAIYFQYFAEVIRELTADRGQRIGYITSDEHDPLLVEQPSGGEPPMRVFHLKRLLPLALWWLDAQVIVMTMTDLDRFHIRRSVRGAHHAYLFHAMMSTHMVYRQGAFDHYDSLLCVGPHHIAEFHRAKALYGYPRGELVEAGYPWLDTLYAEHQRHQQARSASGVPAPRPRALIAPGWASGNILETCADRVIRSLQDAGYEVRVRPHPELVKRSPQLIQDIERTCAAGAASLERDLRSFRSLHEADVLVTDWSGVALEYAFGTERPVVFINTPRKVHNPAYEAFGLVPLEVRMREQLGVMLDPARIDELPEALKRLQAQPAEYRDRIRRCREEAVYHFGRSARVCAEHVLRVCEGDSHRSHRDALSRRSVAVPNLLRDG